MVETFLQGIILQYLTSKFNLCSPFEQFTNVVSYSVFRHGTVQTTEISYRLIETLHLSEIILKIRKCLKSMVYIYRWLVARKQMWLFVFYCLDLFLQILGLHSGSGVSRLSIMKTPRLIGLCPVGPLWFPSSCRASEILFRSWMWEIGT